MIHRFEDFELDTGRCELRRAGAVRAVEPQVFDLLAYLVAHADRLVTRDELLASIWRGRVVSETALSSTVKAARQALDDDGSAQRLVRTVHGRGYRFVGVVEAGPDPATAPPAAGMAVPEDRPSLAVLPFRVADGDAHAARLADGIAESVAAALGRVRSFFVVSWVSSFRFRDSREDVRDIAAALGVRYLVQGSARAAGEALRVNVQLVDAPSREQVWSERVDAQPAAVFDLEDAIVERVAGALEPGVLAAEIRRVRRRRPESLGAYERVLRALPDVWTLDPEANRAATAELERALEEQPDYALALALLSWCHGQHLVYNWTSATPGHRLQALALARRAARLDPDDPLVLVLLGTALCVAGEVEAASHHVARGLQMDPNSAWGWNRSGFIHCYLGDPATACEHFGRALRLSPLDPLRCLVHVGLGLAGFVDARYVEAIGHVQRALVENPDIVWVHRLLAACMAMAGDAEGARRSVALIEAYSPGITADDIVAAIPHQQTAVRDRYREALLVAGFRSG